ncbi:MAG: EAL domain-containing protein [Nocardiaceae bacterium]|nr:EAL domain-containing protein [Nocardiaceae bacterium]
MRIFAQRALSFVTAGFLVTIIPRVRPTPGYSIWFDGVWQCAAFFASAIICSLRISLGTTHRSFWVCINVALYCDALAEALWLWTVGESDAGQASPADGFWLACYVWILVGLVILIRDRVGSLTSTTVADAAIVGFGAAAAGSAALAPYVTATSGGFVANFVNIGYPILDLGFLIGILAVITIYRWQPPPGVWMLFAALSIWEIADLLFVVEVAGSNYLSGGVGDALYVVAAIVAAFAPGHRDHTRRPIPRWLPMVIPVLASTAAVLILFFQATLAPGQLARWAALAAVAAAGARVSMVYSQTQRSAELSRLAHTDDLTGLLNRRGFFRAHHPLLRSAATHAVLVLDLDRFKDINDSLGHHYGDDLLRAAADRILEVLPHTSHIARFGGDEFAVAVPAIRRADAARIADSLFDRLTEPFDLAGLDVMVGVSIGIAQFPVHGRETDTLLRHADFAMFQSKRSGSGPAFYAFDTPDTDSIGSGRSGLELVGEFRAAIDARTLDVHYQPIHEVASGSVVGAEALLRWVHPVHGLLGPGLLLPLAIRHGLMPNLTRAVLDIALRAARRWHDSGHPISVSVNISPSILQQEKLVESILGTTAAAGVPPTSLVLEITEDHFVGDYRRTREVLDSLRRAGVRISLDDFGQGHSILEYLRELTIDEVKLDRSFVSDLASDSRTDAIVATTIYLAHTLGARVVAEGVETAAIDRELHNYGCDLAQGNHYSPALSAVDIETYLSVRGQTR